MSARITWSRVLDKLVVIQLVKKFLALYKLKICYRVHKSPPPVPVLSQMNSLYGLPSIFWVFKLQNKQTILLQDNDLVYIAISLQVSTAPLFHTPAAAADGCDLAALRREQLANDDDDEQLLLDNAQNGKTSLAVVSDRLKFVHQSQLCQSLVPLRLRSLLESLKVIRRQVLIIFQQN
jgi:hypothetical protein